MKSCLQILIKFQGNVYIDTRNRWLSCSGDPVLKPILNFFYHCIQAIYWMLYWSLEELDLLPPSGFVGILVSVFVFCSVTLHSIHCN